MTEQTDDTITDSEAAGLLADPPEPTDDPAAAGGDPAADDAGAESNSEAAKWRRRLRDTEAERDTLRGRLEGMQRREAERAAAGLLADPADLWAFVEMAEVLDDNGDVDASKVTEKANELIKRKPHFGRPAEMPSKRRDGPAINGGNADLAGGGHRPASWSDVLSGRGQQ